MIGIHQDKLTIVSACFYSDMKYAHYVQHSCEKLSLLFSPYGFKETGGNWRNMKVVKLLPHLETVQTPYVLYTDAADSWLLQPEHIILEKFLHKHCDVLVAGERSLYPSHYSLEVYPEAPTTMRYLCAGSFIGKTENVKEALQLMLQDSIQDENDQLLWHRLFLSQQMKIKIDYWADVFLSMGGVSPAEITTNPIHFKETGSVPCLIHFNGGKGGSPNEQAMLKIWGAMQWDKV